MGMRHNASSDAMPTFPVGRVVSIDTAAMNMIIEVEAEEVHLVLKRESLRERPRPKTSAGSSATKSSASKSSCSWEWCASASGKDAWTAYDASICAKLEKAFQRSEQEVSLAIAGTKYRIDLQHMQQINCR